MIKIAFPLKDKNFSPHFENCTSFQIYSIERGSIVKEDIIPVPLNQPDIIPIRLAENDVSDVIAADIGINAVKLLTRHKINVFVGVKARDTKLLLKEYMEGILETSGNLLDH